MTASLRKDGNGSTGGSIWTYAHLTGTGTTLVKTGPGILRSITFNKPVATGTVEFDDALTNTAPVMGIVTVPATPQPGTLTYDIEFTNGLSITIGTAAQDITVAYA